MCVAVITILSVCVRACVEESKELNSRPIYLHDQSSARKFLNALAVRSFSLSRTILNAFSHISLCRFSYSCVVYLLVLVERKRYCMSSAFYPERLLILTFPVGFLVVVICSCFDYSYLCLLASVFFYNAS